MLSQTGVRRRYRGVRALLPFVIFPMTGLVAMPLRGRTAWGAEPEAAPTAATPAKHGAAPAGKLQHLGPAEAASVLGHPVHGPNGQEIGRVIDVLVDRAGHPRAAVIDFGGFMGVGSRKVAVDWHLLRFAPHQKNTDIALALTPDQIKAAPEYKPGENPVIVAAPPAAPTAQQHLSPAQPVSGAAPTAASAGAK
jgi:hypothetical protein